MTKKQGKILVVDDNAGVRKALQLLLTPRFAEVELLPSPVTLPATMDRLHPDAVLLDMNFHADISSGNASLAGHRGGAFHRLCRHQPRGGRHETRRLRLRSEALGQ